MGQSMQDLKKKGENAAQDETEKAKEQVEQKGSEMGNNEKVSEAKKKIGI